MVEADSDNFQLIICQYLLIGITGWFVYTDPFR